MRCVNNGFVLTSVRHTEVWSGGWTGTCGQIKTMFDLGLFFYGTLLFGVFNSGDNSSLFTDVYFLPWLQHSSNQGPVSHIAIHSNDITQQNQRLINCT